MPGARMSAGPDYSARRCCAVLWWIVSGTMAGTDQPRQVKRVKGVKLNELRSPESDVMSNNRA
jgi:hypothetical protein